MKLLTSLALVFSGYTVVCQTLILTPKGGVNLATYSFAEAPYPSYALCYNWGLGLEIKLSNHFSICPEISYNQSGYLFEVDIGSGGLSRSKTVYNTIQIPLLAKYRIVLTNRFQFFVVGGSYASYNLGGHYKDEVISSNGGYNLEGEVIFGTQPIWPRGTQPTFNPSNRYIEFGAERSDFGVILGLGGQYNVGPGAISIEARFGWGLTDFYNKSSIYSTLYNSTNSKSRIASFQIGYALKLGK